jgi:hypothetical protein
VTLADFLDRYGNEMRGLLLQAYAENYATNLFTAKGQSDYHERQGRAMGKQLAEAKAILQRIYTDLTKEVKNEQTKGTTA